MSELERKTDLREPTLEERMEAVEMIAELALALAVHGNPFGDSALKSAIKFLEENPDIGAKPSGQLAAHSFQSVLDVGQRHVPPEGWLPTILDILAKSQS